MNPQGDRAASAYLIADVRGWEVSIAAVSSGAIISQYVVLKGLATRNNTR
ncbi:MAG: hypothetical protein R3C12_21300 [Planctomycetaceae bacterium]|nr:hypothetical protein [Planctomycetaceae bacterium]